MLVYGVEGDRNAACLVKDSKAYIEIAKFVQAYTTIIQNPNEFLSEIGEEVINPETDMLSWDQIVKIMTTCDLGFEPVPNEKQLVSYYAYAKQIGAINKGNKTIASVKDVAEAQKHYYNFIDEEAEKANAIYNRQHEITLARENEVHTIEDNLKKIKSDNLLLFCGMMLSVFFMGFGMVSMFLNNPIARIFGFSNQYVGAAVMFFGGFTAFCILDRFYIKTKKKYFRYQRSTRSAISRSERTSRDEKILKDRLAKYEEDLKVAKYELADKEKRFDVEKNIERLRERNRFYRMLRNRDEPILDGRQRKMTSLLDELDQSILFGKNGLFSMFVDEDGPRRGHHRMRRPEGFFEMLDSSLKEGIRSEKIKERDLDRSTAPTGMTSQPTAPGKRNPLFGLTIPALPAMGGLLTNRVFGERTIPEKPMPFETAHRDVDTRKLDLFYNSLKPTNDYRSMIDAHAAQAFSNIETMSTGVANFRILENINKEIELFDAQQRDIQIMDNIDTKSYSNHTAFGVVESMVSDEHKKLTELQRTQNELNKQRLEEQQRQREIEEQNRIAMKNLTNKFAGMANKDLNSYGGPGK